jgi:hypothetical protein
MNDSSGYYEAAIHPGQINVYYHSSVPRRSTPAPFIDPDTLVPATRVVPDQFRDNHHYGRISPVALRKITKAVQYLTFLVPKRRRYHTPDGRSGNYFLNFITLTLSSPQIHTDNEIKRIILEPFLNEMRKRFKVSSYIWRAERQENGNIHFHIISDRFVWWNDLRNSWNYFQERLGYVSRYRLSMQEFHKEGFQPRKDLQDRWPIHKQLSAWRTGVRTDWTSPNSTDVHSLISIGNVRSYLTKYITKSDDNSDIQGRLWGCSYNLTNLSGSVQFADGQISSEIGALIDDQRVRTYKSEYFTVIYFDPGLLATLHLFLILAQLREYCRYRFPDHFSPELFDP